jgi:hypothetical protein
VATALSNTGASGLASTVGLAQVLSQLGLATNALGLTPATTSSGTDASTATTTTTLPAVLGNVTNSVTSTVKSLLGHS